MIVKTSCGTDGALHSTEDYNTCDQPRLCLPDPHLLVRLPELPGGGEGEAADLRPLRLVQLPRLLRGHLGRPAHPAHRHTPHVSAGARSGALVQISVSWVTLVTGHCCYNWLDTTGDWGGGVLMTKTDR